ncbi:Dirigent protein 23 [Bienertia sinuspersici]
MGKNQTLWRYGHERKTVLQFYFHDIVTRDPPSVVLIAQPKDANQSPSSSFDSCTHCYPRTKLKASRPSPSTVVIFGRNLVMNPVRELPVVGGTGVFRMARGYAFFQTFSVDLTTFNAIVGYIVTVFHP